MEHEGDTNCGRSTYDNLQRVCKGTGRLGNKRTRGDHLDYSIIKVDQSTEKSPGDLRLAFSEKPLANIGVKTLKVINNKANSAKWRIGNT